MKTLIINGSPRKYGGTSVLVEEMAARLGGDIDKVETYRAGISPCVDCRHCWKNHGCAINDAMQNVYRMIDNADNIVIASPIYFGELTGSLLQWASRLQYIYASKRFRKTEVIREKKRNGAVLLVDGGDGYMDTALAMGKRLLRLMGAQYVGHVYFSGTDVDEPASPKDDIATVEAVRRLANMLSYGDKSM